MNNYLMKWRKQHVMRNEVNEIENKRRPKRKWQYVIIAAVLTLSAMLFILNELFIENEQLPADELQVDLTQPIFSEEQGLFYLHGVTLGDSQSKIIERFGDNYTIDQEDDSDADLILNYDGQAKFYFIEEKLDSIVFMNVDEDYFDKFFKDYDGFKFIFHWYLDNDNRLFFSKETSHILHASTMYSGENLYLSLFYAGPDRWEKEAEFLYMKEQNINNQHQTPSDLNIDLTKPTFFEEHGLFYLHGVTLGDSPSKVVEHLGENYIIGQADMTVRPVDFIMDYEGKASFNFYEDKLGSIYLMKIDKNYFDKLFTNYAGLKLIDSPRAVDSDRYFFSKETGQLLKATTNTPNEDLYLYLIPAGKDLLEDPDFTKEQIIDGEGVSSFKKDLEQISVPDMSTSILSSNESEQLKWLSEIYDFELNTLRSKTSGLSEADLQDVRSHLSQIYGVELVELLIDGFYYYDEEDKSYYVPDGSWFTYNERWRSSNLTITNRSEDIVILKLIGIDDYGENEREIDYSFNIFKDRLLLEKRSYLK